MEDTLTIQMAELTLTATQIRNRSPEDLFQLQLKVANLIKQEIATTRLTVANDQWIEYIQRISILWGKWSANHNRTVRQILKETDLFTTLEMRKLSKKYSVLLLYWTTWNRLFETLYQPLAGIPFKAVVMLTEQIKDEGDYFYNIDKEEQWKILNQSEE